VYLFKTFQYSLNWSYAAEMGIAMFAILVVAVVAYLAVARPHKE
jgi:hypothetical protein